VKKPLLSKTATKTAAKKPKQRKPGLSTQKRLDGARARNQQLKAENALLGRQIEAMLEEMDLQLCDIKEEKAALKKSLQWAAQREEALQETVAARDEEIRALHRSSSWKITAPLRRIKLLFGQARG